MSLRNRLPYLFTSQFRAKPSIYSLLLLVLLSLFVASCAPRETTTGGRTEIRWGTSAVGSSGHRALVNLAALLNREMPELQITVLPMPGAIMGVRGYLNGSLDGCYGANIAFREYATGTGRFQGPPAAVPPVQSFWAYTMEMGLGIRKSDKGKLAGWGDLRGKTIFTGPLPWDTRAHLNHLLETLGVDHKYVELDLGMAGTQLSSGSIDAIGVYTTGERSLAPWIAEAELVSDFVVLNPSATEREQIAGSGFELVAVSPELFRNGQGGEVLLSPFFYGFHLSLETPEDLVFRILETIETHADELAASDAVFGQLAANMALLQRRGIAHTHKDALIHPGLARFLRERDQWNAEWDSQVAPPAADGE